MYYTVYKTTNNIDGKIYIGVHKTDNLDDGYMGSGKILKRAINKYGIENFTKEILQVFDSSEDMFEMESTLVNEEFVKRTDTYNIKEGGEGGWNHLNDGSDEHIKRAKKGRSVVNEKYGTDWLSKIAKMGAKKALDTNRRNGTGCCHDKSKRHSFLGKSHSQEAKNKIGAANSKHQSGKGNSNYGKCWIYHPDLKKSKSIPRYEIDKWLADGWLKGRKMKFT